METQGNKIRWWLELARAILAAIAGLLGGAAGT